MQTIAVVGLDLAKTVFQVHGVAADGTRRETATAPRLGSGVFSNRLGQAWSGLKRAPRPTSGRES